MPSALREIDLPDFGVPEARPELSRDRYAARFVRFADRVAQFGLDAAVVYADREHFANLAYLSGFDPRFEEALLVFVPGRYPVLLTGPENQGMARAAPIELDVRLYPPFGLLGQDRQEHSAPGRPAAERRTGRRRQDRRHRLEVFRQGRGVRAGELDRPTFLYRRYGARDRRPVRPRRQRDRGADGREHRHARHQRGRPARPVRIRGRAGVGSGEAGGLRRASRA